MTLLLQMLNPFVTFQTFWPNVWFCLKWTAYRPSAWTCRSVHGKSYNTYKKIVDISNKTGLGRSHTRRVRKRMDEIFQWLAWNGKDYSQTMYQTTQSNRRSNTNHISDGSNNAYDACAYVRWGLSTREFVSYIILSKNRLAPVKRMLIDRIELCGAVLKKRLKTVLKQQCRYNWISKIWSPCRFPDSTCYDT